MSQGLHNLVRQCRAKLKQLARDSDANLYERVKTAVDLWKIWHHPELADPALEIERREELDRFLQNGCLTFDEFSLMLEYFPDPQQWANIQPRKMLESALSQRQTATLEKAAERRKNKQQKQPLAPAPICKPVQSPPEEEPYFDDARKYGILDQYRDECRQLKDENKRLQLQLELAALEIKRIAQERDALKSQLREAASRLQPAYAH